MSSAHYTAAIEPFADVADEVAGFIEAHDAAHGSPRGPMAINRDAYMAAAAADLRTSRRSATSPGPSAAHASAWFNRTSTTAAPSRPRPTP